MNVKQGRMLRKIGPVSIKEQLQSNEDAYLQIANQIAYLNTQVKELKTDIINDMRKLGITETNGLQLVIQQRTDFNADALKAILPAIKYNKIKTDTIDRKAFEAAVELGIVNPVELLASKGIKVTEVEILRRR